MSEKQEIKRNEKVTPEATPTGPVYLPDTDIYQSGGSILVRCDMPGVEDAAVDIMLEDDVLTLSGMQTVSRPDGYELLVGEFDTGVYRRAFTVPGEVDREKIKARLRNGVLDIELPKAEQVQPKRIQVSVND
jgi:HSP20 family protein